MRTMYETNNVDTVAMADFNEGVRKLITLDLRMLYIKNDIIYPGTHIYS